MIQVTLNVQDMTAEQLIVILWAAEVVANGVIVTLDDDMNEIDRQYVVNTDLTRDIGGLK